MQNARLDEAQAGIRIARRNNNNLRYTDNTTLMAESEEKFKSLLMKERGEWKIWLKTQHSNKRRSWHPVHQFMANRWETVETVSDFMLLGSKITADGDCSHEIKRHLLLGRKVMTNLDSILKSKDIYFVNKGPSSQGYGFSNGHVWMWELDCEEGWAWRTDAFELWCWRRSWESLGLQGDPTSPT